MKPSFQLSHPVIAAVRTPTLLPTALKSKVKVIFLMGGDLCQAHDITRQTQASGKQIFLHVDLLKGIGRDREAIEFIHKKIRPEGIVTTKPHLLQAANKQGLATVLQIFMIDSQAFETGIKNIHSYQPDAVEIMPGLMPRIAMQVKAAIEAPLICAGMIKQPNEVETMLEVGCEGIAASETALWNYLPNTKKTL